MVLRLVYLCLGEGFSGLRLAEIDFVGEVNTILSCLC